MTARRATFTSHGLGTTLPPATNRRAIQDPQVGEEAAGIPSGVGRPGPGTDIPPGGRRAKCTAGKCQPLAQVYSAYTQPPSPVYSEEHMPRPPAVVGVANPSASSTRHTTQGTGAQGKTPGRLRTLSSERGSPSPCHVQGRNAAEHLVDISLQQSQES